MPHAAVSHRQRNRAKILRQRMTRAETLLWRYIKAHHIDGLAFRRQVPMGAYTVDFVCHAAKLVVELDGESHDFGSRLERDRVRDAWLEARGYIVLRFTNEQVLTNLEGVTRIIRDTANSRSRDLPPSLSLPRKGGGNPATTSPQTVNQQTPSRPSLAGGGGNPTTASPQTVNQQTPLPSPPPQGGRERDCAGGKTKP